MRNIRLNDVVNRLRYSSLEKAEKAIRNKKEGETAIIFDEKGRYLFSRTESGSQIVFTDAEMTAMKNAIVTHNHPSGTSFGDTDISTACNAQVKEIRVVTRDYTFSMRHPSGDWNIEFWHKTLNPARLDAEQAVMAHLGDAVGEGHMTEEEYRFHYIDRSWELVAEKTGIVYDKIRRVQ